MKKIHELPAWFDQDLEDHDNWLGGAETVFERDGACYFDGVLGALLRGDKVPHRIEIALDAADWGCLARLEYGDGSDEQAAYIAFEIESFALLWNMDPASVHGIEGDRITLCLNESDTRYPFVASAGVICNLFIRDGRFRAEPDIEFAAELLEEAA
jgi:hypothetical protein